ncbi:hypothetical protein [Rubrivirga marina]|uniref:Uncharacterized protein n=1 Tax=Rubrivirga marina TaxID=1196024 RepID=A0A271J2N4_9BACT|nr:hypothetical protein [Rubrivirga marina]PAP76979.1 hypothetical protein BSZ37_11320 [Rubrivirga marina]
MEARSALDNIKSAITVAHGLKGLSDGPGIGEAANEIEDYLFDARLALVGLLDEVESLKAKVQELEAFSSGRYELKEPEIHRPGAYWRWRGRRAYYDQETDTYYCPGCFGKRTLVPVQMDLERGETAPCPICQTHLGYAEAL